MNLRISASTNKHNINGIIVFLLAFEPLCLNIGMTIISYNINGLRSVMRKGFESWLAAANPDILCLQEIRCFPNQIDASIFERLGYHLFWAPAEKKGYSGVAIFSKKLPNTVTVGLGIPEFDTEGRILRLDFGSLSVVSVYVPSGAENLERHHYKMRFLEAFFNYTQILMHGSPHCVLAGDYNICHQTIDLHNPAIGARIPGFLPEERNWISALLKLGVCDSFRHLNPEPHQYSWWSYRYPARQNNLGWRIDYQFVSDSLLPFVNRAGLLKMARFSDHCPTLLALQNLERNRP